MSQHRECPDNEGLQVDIHTDQAAKAPEVDCSNQAAKAPAVAFFNQDGHFYDAFGLTQGRKPPFVLGLWAFTGIVILLTAIVVGAGVGGGLGAALMNKPDCQEDTAFASTPSAEPTSCPTIGNDTSESNTTSYIPKHPSEVTTLQLVCPDDKKDDTKYESPQKGFEFRWWCGVDAPYGEESKEGGYIDNISILSYSIEDCMEACINLYRRDFDGKIGWRCRSVVFSKIMANDYDLYSANCWLKNGSKATGSNWRFENENIAYAALDIRT